MIKVHGHQRLIVIGQNALERTVRCRLDGVVVLLRAVKLKSTKDTLMVGTRIAKPSISPFNSGNTRPTAAAAPVLAGIMDMVAERARRKSEWYTSVST